MNVEALSPQIDETEMPMELKALVEEIAALPEEYQKRLQPLIKRILLASKRRRKILTLVQEALSQLRLDMKYLVFDLEATRRERDELQSELKD